VKLLRALLLLLQLRLFNMATFVSKFNINDTAYVVNADTFTLDTVVITDIYIRQSLTFPGGTTTYLVSYRGRTTGSIKDFDEAVLYYLDEAKAALGILISARSTQIGSMQ
jgi:hypothetical protein